MKKYFKRKPRIEKKFTKRAMELLLKLMPSQYKEDSFYLDVNEWCWGEFDYWGEFDSYDSFFELHKNLITMTTDWENLYRAGENNEDKTPYFSPWRINYKVGRREVISHCHKLVKAGVVWGCVMKERKPLFVNSAPFLDENFNQVSADLATARRKANEMERKTRKLNWGKNAIGFVFEADTHFNVSVGFECRTLN